MRIITKRAITECWKKYSDARTNLAIWEERINAALVRDHNELREILPHADYIPNENFKHLTIFNIKKNDYRLAVDIFFNTGHVFVKWFGTHTAYDSINFYSLPNKGFVLC